MAFLKVRCKNCGHNQVVNERASTIVKCNKCNVTMQKPKGGKAQTRAEILEVLR